MTIITFSILVAIGLIVGLFTGAFGLGGGLLLIPALVYFLGLSQQTAQGTSIAIMLLPVGIFASLNYYKAGCINIRYATIIAISFMISSYFGSKIALAVPEPIMKKIFGSVIFIIALKMILSK
jgi:uncharacterized protein